MHVAAESSSSVKPISRRKLRANRRNARKSTGPRTAAGKARSCRNAETHRVFCSCLVLNGESQSMMHAIRDGLLDSLRPQNVMELAIVDRIVQAQWRLNRCQESERMMHESIADYARTSSYKQAERLQRKHQVFSFEELEAECDKNDPDDQRLLEHLKHLINGANLKEMPASVTLAISLNAAPGGPDAGLDRLSRYEQRLEGTINRSLRQLKMLRGNSDPRTWGDLPPSPFVDDRSADEEESNKSEAPDPAPAPSAEPAVLRTAAKAQPEKLQNEPTAEKSDASVDDSTVCEKPVRQETVQTAPSEIEARNPKPEIRNKTQ